MGIEQYLFKGVFIFFLFFFGYRTLKKIDYKLWISLINDFPDRSEMDIKTIKDLYQVNPSKWEIKEGLYLIYKAYEESFINDDIKKINLPNGKTINYESSPHWHSHFSKEIYISVPRQDYPKFKKFIKKIQDEEKLKKKNESKRIQSKNNAENTTFILKDAQKDINKLLKQSESEIKEASQIQHKVLNNLSKERS